MRYLIFENTSYWTANQYFVVAQAGLLAFFGYQVEKHPLFALLVGFIGCAIANYWTLTVLRIRSWQSRWRSLCLAIEPKAFGSRKVFRNAPDTGVRRMVEAATRLFVLVWLILIAYAVWILWSTSRPEFKFVPLQ
jgi:hypothetical protein